MKCILQRTTKANVRVNSEIVGQIDKGWVILLGVDKNDTEEEIHYLAEKIIHLRAFKDEFQKMNLSVKDIDGSILLISQFTLFGNCKKGRRPSFSDAANPDKANKFYELMKTRLQEYDINVETGIFGADMKVELINDGPVTLILDSNELMK